MMSPWYSVLVAAVILAFVALPGAFLRLGVLLFPKDHERRCELVAELYHVPRWKRPVWVAGNLIRCFSEGPLVRIQAKQVKKAVYLRLKREQAERELDQAMREWGRNQGMNVTDRGPIPKEVVDAYNATDD
jgi:hypothetical protein